MAKTPKWNEIPFDPNATPEEKGKEFDAQYAENQVAANEPRFHGQFNTVDEEFPEGDRRGRG